MAAVLEENNIEVNIIDACALEMDWKILLWSLKIFLQELLQLPPLHQQLEKRLKLQTTAFKKFYLRPAYLIRQVLMDGPMLIKTIFGVVRNILLPSSS